MNNYLLDSNFLSTLDLYRQRETYVKITALSFQDQPLEEIEGRITQGSISIDGASSLRRTCSLTMVAQGLDINDYYWGLKNKFKLEIGLKNTIKDQYNEYDGGFWRDKYPQDIIWFPQGTYIINTFNVTQNATSYTISITGKDKMCLLNGNMGGSLTAPVDFGVEQFYNKETNTTIYNKIPIERIIREAVHTYALEPYYNIVISDLDEVAVELLEYRGDGSSPMYLLREVDTGDFTNFTMNGSVIVYPVIKDDDNSECYLDNARNSEKNQLVYDNRVNLADNIGNNPTVVVFKETATAPQYTIARIEYGQTVGYRPTDLTYAGDLVAKVGETITSILDKIVKMLGDYEYFYDIDGRFIFQKKKTYLSSSWNNIIKIGADEYVQDAAHSSSYVYKFTDGNLITSFANSPKLDNLKNDFSIWGERRGISGIQLPIHYRYAIDIKPKIYTSIQIDEDDITGHNSKYPNAPLEPQKSVCYITEEYEGDKPKDCEIEIRDWRELIYQMALDNQRYSQLDCYAARLKKANPEYLHGTTGYEQYYTDLLGYWRELYNPQPEVEKEKVLTGGLTEFISKDNLYLKGTWKTLNKNKDEDFKSILEYYKDIYVINAGAGDTLELIPWTEALKLDRYYDSFEGEEGEDGEKGPPQTSTMYFLKNENDTYVEIPPTQKNLVNKDRLFIKTEGNTFISIFENDLKNSTRVVYHLYEPEGYTKLKQGELSSGLLNVFKKDDTYQCYRQKSQYDITGNPIANTLSYIKNDYYKDTYLYIKDNDWKDWTVNILDAPDQLNFWFDFLDAESELGQFSVPMIGDRVKAVNDTSVTSIYFREVPKLIFTTSSDRSDLSGYSKVYINRNLESLFSISSQGRSAHELKDELLYNHSYCIENITIQSIPIYHLKPNVRVFVQDNKNNIEGEYIITKLTIPLDYKGVMSITANKALTRLI